MRKGWALARAASSAVGPLHSILPNPRCASNNLPLSIHTAQPRYPFTTHSIYRAQSDSAGSTPARINPDVIKDFGAEAISDEELEQYMSGAFEDENDKATQPVIEKFLNDALDSSEPDPVIERANGFFAYEEDPGQDTEADPEAGPDDISTPAHFELEQQRELREFARVMAWDMPLLYDLRRPFVAPRPEEQPLRFRYTTYMGETHPASKKVVLEFSPASLPGLNLAQKSKLIKLLGPRYNPDTGKATMSAEYHPTAAQNKRHLGETLQNLLLESREGRDDLQDIPMDFRHHRKARKIRFPHKWKMTEAKAAELEKIRQGRTEAEQTRLKNNQLTDGRLIVERLSSPTAHASTNVGKTLVRVGVRVKSGL